MNTVTGILKLGALVAADFAIVYAVSNSGAIALILVSLVALYAWLGGYISLLKDGAVSIDKLPVSDTTRLAAAKELLVKDVQEAADKDISNIKLYLTPDDSLNATAYGCGCISVNQGLLNNTDPVTLAAVLAHEISHTYMLDAEFNRILFASVTALVLALSVVSALSMGLLFVLFIILCCCFKTLRSWLGLILYQGSTKMVGGTFSLFQRLIVFIYQSINGLISRASEYRADKFSGSLGYGPQLAYFLSIAGSKPRRLTLTDVLYRSHPPAEQRIYRLEQSGGK